MGDVCRSRNASLSEHRSAYNGVNPFLNLLCQRLECRNIGGHNTGVSLLSNICKIGTKFIGNMCIIRLYLTYLIYS